MAPLLATGGSRYFYPRSPCGERLFLLRKITITVDISIHALLAESDTLIWDVIAVITISIHALLAESDVFLLRKITITVDISIHALLAESDQYSGCSARNSLLISIHALLAESDRSKQPCSGFNIHFYPRSPCGERRGSVAGNWRLAIFLSTLSLRRATHPKYPTEYH